MLFAFAERQLTADSMQQFLLRMLSDHYYLTFCLTPLFFLYLYRSLEEELPFALIRSKTFSRYFFTKSMAIVVNSLLLVLFQLAAISIASIGLASRNVFPGNNAAENDLFFEFAKYLETPLSAALCSALFLVIGLSLIGFILQTMHHFLEKRAIAIIGILLYVVMILALKIPALSKLPFVPNRYIILHYNFYSSTAWIWTAAGVAIAGTAAFLLIRYGWNRQLKIKMRLQPKGLFFYYARSLWLPKNLAILLSAILLIYLLKGLTTPALTVQESFLSYFYGQVPGQFQVMSLLEALLYHGAPLYLIAVFTESMARLDSLPIFVRMQHKFNWFKVIVGNSFLLVTVYVLMTGLLIIVFGTLSGQSWGGISFAGKGTISEDWIFQLILLKIGEFSLQYLGFLVLFLVTKNVTLSYLLVLATHSLSVLSFHSLLYFPIGLSTVARLDLLEESIGIPVFQAAVILIGGIFFLYSVSYASYKRFFD